MKLIPLTYSIVLLTGFTLWGCEEVIETDIEGKTVALISPGDSIVSKDLDQLFQWEALDGAREYRVQIGSPSLQKIDGFYLDTVIGRNRLGLVLAPGEYQWRVQGLNAGYNSAFTSRFLVIDSTAKLNSQAFNLLSPAQNAVTNNNTVLFRWENVPGATKYVFQFLNAPTFDTIVYTNQFTKKLPAVTKSYTWKVTALNTLSLKESAARQFDIDITAPLKPDLLFPKADTSFFTLPLRLSWSRKSNDISYDSLFIYNNQNQVLANFPKRVNATFFSLTTTDLPAAAAGSYFWAVKSVDQAGNAGPLSVLRRFVKQ